MSYEELKKLDKAEELLERAHNIMIETHLYENGNIAIDGNKINIL